MVALVLYSFGANDVRYLVCIKIALRVNFFSSSAKSILLPSWEEQNRMERKL
uniref:Uncharacterized protein n=1 Tax=Arundo donax TaxID=35708 RepID=A0A0A8YCX0_ARUDO